MNLNESLFVGDDFFTLKTPAEWADTNRVYEITGAPRCTPLRYSFVHSETVQVFILQGSFAFEIEDKTSLLQQGEFLCIPAASKYRFH